MIETGASVLLATHFAMRSIHGGALLPSASFNQLRSNACKRRKTHERMFMGFPSVAGKNQRWALHRPCSPPFFPLDHRKSHDPLLWGLLWMQRGNFTQPQRLQQPSVSRNLYHCLLSSASRRWTENCASRQHMLIEACLRSAVFGLTSVTYLLPHYIVLFRSGRRHASLRATSQPTWLAVVSSND